MTENKSIPLSRVWAMPNSQTFLIEPIKELLARLVCGYWVDPFAGRNSPAGVTNDRNSKMPTLYHQEAVDFLSRFEDGEFIGVLLDPPYSMRRVVEMYKGQLEIYKGQYVSQLTLVLNEAARVVRVGGLTISFGWNSNGLGKKRGFEIIELLVVAHGGQHNDTLVVVERKMR